MRRIGVGVCIVLLGLLAGARAGAMPLTILYTNDLHMRFERLESLSELIANERAAAQRVLLFDAGDTWQDFRVPLYAVWGAEEMVDWMNAVGYDAMALGNHDLYWGADQLANLSRVAEFPLLCANLIPTVARVPPFVPYTFLEVDGIRVLVVGLIGAEYLPYRDFPWLWYVEPEIILRSILDENAREADVVVVLAHLPLSRAKKVVEAVPKIDLFITGHSHELTPEPVREGTTLLVQAGAYGRYLGRLVLDVDPETGTTQLICADLLPTETAPVKIGRGLIKLLEVTVVLIGLLAISLQKR